MSDKLQIKPNSKILWDSFSGLIKGIYLYKSQDKITIQITSYKNRTYKYREIITVNPLHVIPRECYHKTGLFTFSVYPDYEFI